MKYPGALLEHKGLGAMPKQQQKQSWLYHGWRILSAWPSVGVTLVSLDEDVAPLPRVRTGPLGRSEKKLNLV